MKYLLLIPLAFVFFVEISKAAVKDSISCTKTDTSCVVKERTLERSKNSDNRAIYGDYIEIKVKGVRYLIDSIAKGKKDSLILFLNNIPLNDIHPNSIDIDYARDTGLIVFVLNRKSVALKKICPYFLTMTSAKIMPVSIGVKDKPPIQTKVKVTLRYVMRGLLIITLGAFLLCVLGIIFLSKKFYIIRVGNTPESPYSLARFQLAFWTVLVAFSFLYLWVVNAEIPDMPTSVLVLLGISIGTKGVAFYIDYNKKDKPDINTGSKGFLKDILSDDNGINIQRAQMVLWTVILGFIFLHAVFTGQKMLDFDTNLLALMGISSGTYALLKTMETKGTLPETVKPDNNMNTNTTNTSDKKDNKSKNK